jgi:FdhD protein
MRSSPKPPALSTAAPMSAGLRGRRLGSAGRTTATGRLRAAGERPRIVRTCAKAVLAGIPVLAAVSAPSSLAAGLAEDVGLTLVGFLRGASMNVHTRGQRISPGWLNH